MAERGDLFKARFETLITEGCHVTYRGNVRIQVSDRCGFLRGIYRFQEVEGDNEFVVPFALSRQGENQHIFLVEAASD